ncbi:MAG TPA: branched-chain amino acid ABC transporter permease, partial [Dehalococcoidia bacterium]|nr:branched-chain amino acid ABC transporter permease [Dehalococcoidia bacterium]
MQQWLQQTVNGLTVGGVYALLALGYTMVYGVLQMINFAHGDVFMLGAFGGYYVLSALDLHTSITRTASWLAIIVAMLVGAVVSAAAAVVIERLAYRPLRRAPRLAPLISAIGVSFLLENIMLRRTNAQNRNYPPIFPGGGVHVVGVQISYVRIFLIGMSFVFLALLYLLVMRTRTGRAIRAVAEDRDLAALMGVDVDRTIVITFVIGALLAGATGVMYGFYITQIG